MEGERFERRHCQLLLYSHRVAVVVVVVMVVGAVVVVVALEAILAVGPVKKVSSGRQLGSPQSRPVLCPV